ncbi:ribosome-associated translation inhibitor RaiA [candidate division KSB1 bacterium]|nr:ribosome-associated translation inhibitor RaiA [candidate division KSB1 bacterium]
MIIEELEKKEAMGKYTNYLFAGNLKIDKEVPMRISFTARHFKSSDRLKDFAINDVHRLKKYYDDILEVEIVLDYVKQEQVAEIVVKVFGQRLTVVEKSEDMYKSITLAVDKLERKLLKYKEKMRHFDKERIAENIEPELELED